MLQKTVEVHAGADASVWRPLHHIHCHAIYRGAWDSMVDPNALREPLNVSSYCKSLQRDVDNALVCQSVNIVIPNAQKASRRLLAPFGYCARTPDHQGKKTPIVSTHCLE